MLPQTLQAARLRLVKSHPYLSSAAWALRPVEKPGLETLAVDMYWRLYYDPVVITRWTVEELAGVLYHEIMHLLRDHASRMQNFDRNAANIAADAEINDDLIAEGVKLPEAAGRCYCSGLHRAAGWPSGRRILCCAPGAAVCA